MRAGDLLRVEGSGPQDPPLLDGQPAVCANALRIDLLGDVDRRDDADRTAELDTCFFVANNLLRTYRSVARAGFVRPITQLSVWRGTFLQDDGTPFAAEDGHVRSLGSAVGRMQSAALPEDAWALVADVMSEYAPSRWETLLLDSLELLPEVGPPLVLAATAVETRIEALLNALADAGSIDSRLWEWINDRGDFRKEPSTVEQLDVLLAVLGGRSLKNEPMLWEQFKNLRSARNSFVHEGIALIGRTPVDGQLAGTLVNAAFDIVTWLDGLDPAGCPTPRSIALHEVTTYLMLQWPLEHDEPADAAD